MKKVIVNSWTEIPLSGGVESWKHNTPEEAFKYAETEYYPYGYNVAYYATLTGTLYLFRA